jgi:hypothetical protein
MKLVVSVTPIGLIMRIRYSTRLDAMHIGTYVTYPLVHFNSELLLVDPLANCWEAEDDYVGPEVYQDEEKY